MASVENVGLHGFHPSDNNALTQDMTHTPSPGASTVKENSPGVRLRGFVSAERYMTPHESSCISMHRLIELSIS
jgi:hypothetical protein